MDQPNVSGWIDFPTADNPYAKYKYSSVSFNLDLNMQVINRQTYMFLDWLGDLGGLFDALCLICAAIISPMQSHTLKSRLMTLTFLSVGDKSTP